MTPHSQVMVMGPGGPNGPKAYPLPAPPGVLVRILEAAADPSDASLKKLSELVNGDPVFVAELLRVANSPLFGLKTPVSSAQRAVTVLGLRGLRTMALCAASRSCVDPKELGDFDLNRFLANSLRRAVAARLLSERLNIGDDPWECFTIGLLQDLGVLALIRSAPHLADRWMAHAGASNDQRRALEAALFGTSHDQIAEQLAEAWYLPDVLAIPMRWHHEPEKAPDAYRALARVAWLAELFADVMGADDKASATARLNVEGGLDPDLIHELLGRMVDEFAEAALLFQVTVRQDASVGHILQAANASLVEMSLDYEGLVRRLEQTLELNRLLQRELETRTVQLERMAITDELTGLPNRRAWQRRVDLELKRVARYGGELALLIIDVDHFKAFNDSYGHSLGDRVLSGVGAELEQALRAIDIAARIGGEEFAVLLPATGPAGAVIVADRIREAVGARSYRTPDGDTVSATCSVGVVTTHREGDKPVKFDVDAFGSKLFSAADQGLYDAKDAGRNCTILVAALPIGEVS